MGKYIKKTKKLYLRDFLSIDEIDDIDKRIGSTEPFYDIFTAYSKKLNYKGKDILYEYIKQRRNPIELTRILGSKVGPYYQSEDDMKLPEYKWEDLPANERALLIKESKDE